MLDFQGGSGAVPDERVAIQDELLARFSEADTDKLGLVQAPTEAG